jgi:hypothetical protein
MKEERERGLVRGSVLRWRSALVCAGVVLTACDVPTTAPRFQSRLLFPAEPAVLGVAELLPASVQVVGGSFRVQVAPVTLATRSVAALCGATCVVVPGLQVPKPSFTESSAVTLSLASDVAGATLSGGAIDIALTHGLEFDPLRPPGAVENGSIRVSARSAGREVAAVVIDDAFPRGATLRRTLPLTAVEVAGDVVVSVVLYSPAGGPVPSEWLLTDEALVRGTVTPLGLEASEVRVRVHEKPVSLAAVPVDVSGIDDGVIQRVHGGAARVTIDNPFAVTGTFELELRHSGVVVRRTVQLAANRSTTRIELSEAELQLLLGHALTMSLAGVVTAQDGEVAVRPGQEIRIGTSFELVLEIG